MYNLHCLYYFQHESYCLVQLAATQNETVGGQDFLPSLSWDWCGYRVYSWKDPLLLTLPLFFPSQLTHTAS